MTIREISPPVHELKTHPQFFDGILDGTKTFEYRRNDRGGYAVGDVLHLREWDPRKEVHTGRETTRVVTYILDDMTYGVAPGYAVLALAALPEQPDVHALLAEARIERDRLRELVYNPQIDDFLEGVRAEAAHQVKRWGTAAHRSKSAENWFWLVGYLAGKMFRAWITADREKAMHHAISTAATLYQCHVAISDDQGAGEGDDADLREILGYEEEEEDL